MAIQIFLNKSPDKAKSTAGGKIKANDLTIEKRIIPIGNAAGQGSKMAALSKAEFLRSVEIGKTTEYIELAGMPEFNDVFMDKMEF